MGIVVEQLSNGLKIVTEHISQVESAAIGLWINAGLESEPDRLLGISHYLEHMLFKGTERRTARQISEEIDGVGGLLNALTDREYTCIHAHLLGEHLPLAVDILFDMAIHSRLAPEDVEIEREVIIQESRRLEDNPEEYVHDLAVETAWQGHPLGRSLHGDEETIKAVSREDLLAQRRSHYAPEKMLVVAAGAVNHGQLITLVEEASAGLRPGLPVETLPPPSFQSRQKRIQRPIEQVHLCLALPGCSQMDEDRYALALCDTLLGGFTSSRLFQEIREKRGLAYSIGSYSISCRSGGLFFIHAGTGSENLSKVLDLIQAEIGRFCQEGVSETELSRAKAHVRASLALARESTSFRMQRLAQSIFYEGKVISHRKLVQRFERVSLEDLRRAAKRFLSPAPTLVAVGPVE